MYTSFFGLNEKPFSITPDPRYLFMSERHGEALAHLVYGVTESGGFIQLTGEVGTGKTTLVRTLLLNRMPDNADVAVVLNPQITAIEFLTTICEELEIAVPDERDSIKALTDALNKHLLAAHSEGRRTILVVDEAQNLAPAVLEQVRLLTNLETSKQKLLQIILIGQPELRELLARNDLRQLAQRITGRYHLEPLTREETAQYIEHRLRVAGALGEVLDSGAKKAVFDLSGGVPRLVNVICDRALLGAYAEESRVISRKLIRRAAKEISGDLDTQSSFVRWSLAAAVVAVAVVAASLWSANREVPATTDSTQVAELTQPASEPASQVLEAAVIVEEEVQPSLNDELALAAELTSPDFAMASLFDQWGLTYTTGAENGCVQAAAAGLSCFSQRTSWSGLKQFNRPAILTIVDVTGRTHQVVLTAINGERAELSLGGVTVTHPVSDITELWFGQFTLLWRPPGGSTVALTPGAQSADVVWLRESLADIDERYASTAADASVYDAQLSNIVRQFQSDHQLDVDGLAGQQTLVIVSALLGSDDSPRLNTARLARE